MKLFLFVLLSLFITKVSSQRSCFTYNPDKIEALQKPSLSLSGRDTLPNEIFIVPVVVHILYNDASQSLTDEQIRSQLTVLNNDFRKRNTDVSEVPYPFLNLATDARITFCLARVDPVGRPTSGIIHKHTTTQVWTADDAMKFSASAGDDAWDAKRYLNIWVCNLFGRNLGYSSLPGGIANKDGVVIQYGAFGTIGSVAPFNKGRTATHEIGHWLGLKHLWGDADCGDDGIADTPPQKTYNNGCPTFPHTSSCSANSNGDMFMNYMDFSNDACMHMFTRGQVSEMRGMFSAGGIRNSFLTTNVCDSILAQGAPLPADSFYITQTYHIYPNPATTYINISSAKQIVQPVTFSIYNVLGKSLFTSLISSQKTTISLKGFVPGMYVIRIGDGKDVVSLSFMKE